MDRVLQLHSSCYSWTSIAFYIDLECFLILCRPIYDTHREEILDMKIYKEQGQKLKMTDLNIKDENQRRNIRPEGSMTA